MNREQPAGIIDTISMGYGLVNRRPWLVVIPILLDIFFWFGPRLSIQPLLDAVLNVVGRQGTANADMVERLRLLGGQLNLFLLLAAGQIPSLLRGLDPQRLPLGDRQVVLTIDGALLSLGLIIALLLVGLVLWMIYAVPIGQAVRGEAAGLAITGRRAVWAVLRVLGLAVVLLSGTMLVVVPLSIVGALLSGAGLNLLPLLELALSVVALWLSIYLYFAISAIVVSDAGPLRAIGASVSVVRQNFWSSLGLIVLTLVISAGLAAIFQLISVVLAGLPIAIAAHAYINTGLVAASMIFYRDRLARVGKPFGADQRRS